LQRQWAGIGTVLTARIGITGLGTVAVVTIVTQGILRCMVTIIQGITRIYGAGNTIITGHITGLVLAVTILVAGIRGTPDPIITVPISEAVNTPVMGLITQKGRKTAVIAAHTLVIPLITALSTVTVYSVIGAGVPALHTLVIYLITEFNTVTVDPIIGTGIICGHTGIGIFITR